MRSPLRFVAAVLLACTVISGFGFGSAYNARPKLVVIIVIDQFRGDYLERYRDQFGEGGFKLLLDHGANFTNCNYDYANTRTAPGHATLLTGAYSNGHGIMANEWWDPSKKRLVTSVFDDGVQVVGMAGKAEAASPHNLLADTLGDEMKLATQGKSRVFAVALKDRAAILPGGFAADGAFWIDKQSGVWITSSYYRSDLPKWAQRFNDSNRAAKYLNKDWNDAKGNLLRSTAPAGNRTSFYDLVGSTPLANDYEFEFARELVTYEQLGKGSATDLLVVSLSANDILGHEVGPDSPEMQAMALALDHQLADFFGFLGHQLGLANIWIAFSADHGVAPVPAVASRMRIPGRSVSGDKLQVKLNQALNAKFSPTHHAEYITDFDYPLVWLSQDAFGAAKTREGDAEQAAGEALKQLGLRGYYTKAQMQQGELPNSEEGRQYAHSYSPLGGWYVLGIPAPYTVDSVSGTDHGTPYTYDTHVPLAFYGLPFQPGTYRSHAEPVDMVQTIASLLGINAPTRAIGRVLTEALAPERRTEATRPGSGSKHAAPAEVQPAAITARMEDVQ